jgi:hypothetical protein
LVSAEHQGLTHTVDKASVSSDLYLRAVLRRVLFVCI